MSAWITQLWNNSISFLKGLWNQVSTWTYICTPCRRDRHENCLDSPTMRCDCAKSGHGKPRKDKS